jgi:hypothetical protein
MGKLNVKVLPRPGSLATRIVPPCISTNRLTSADDRLEETALARRDLIRECAVENLTEPEDRVERRAELVAHGHVLLCSWLSLNEGSLLHLYKCQSTGPNPTIPGPLQTSRPPEVVSDTCILCVVSRRRPIRPE